MYIILGLGVSNKAVVKALKELNKDFILVCKQEEIKEAINYHYNVIEFESLKYIDLNKVKYAIKSPGIPYYNEHIRYLKKKRIKIINEIELTYILTRKKGKYIGVSGSVGKSSVVSLLYNLVKKKNNNVILAGNIGIPLITYINKINKDTIIILEVSSFQLDDFVNMKFDISLLLNIFDNHLDVYKRRQIYYQSKFKLTNKQTTNDYFIVNLDNKIIRNQLLNHSYCSRLIDYKTGFNLMDNKLYYYGNKIIDLKKYNLLGEHNLDNLKSIICVLNVLRIELDETTLSEFQPLKYHLEERKIKGLKFINDSKSTSTSSLKSALETYKEENIILLFGGYNKNLNFAFLNDYKIKRKICFGELSKNIESMVIVDDKFNTLKEACMFAFKMIDNNDVILFSPGCASFDEFNNYIERGEAFNKYIEDYFYE